jgi:hypothetical protein
MSGGVVQQVHEPAAGIEQLGRGRTGDHGGSVRRRLRRRNLPSAKTFSDYWHIELEHETEIGHLLACLDHVADDWQIERGQEVSRLVEDVC